MNVPCAACGKEMNLAGFNRALFYALKNTNMIPQPLCGDAECCVVHAGKYNRQSKAIPTQQINETELERQ